MPRDAGCSQHLIVGVDGLCPRMQDALGAGFPPEGASLPALGERRPWDAAVPHWSAGPVESAGCHTNLPLVPGQPGREVPGRAGAKGRIRS